MMGLFDFNKEENSRESYCVIGLGRFGSAVADHLLELKKDVVLVDVNVHKLDHLSLRVRNEMDKIVAADTTSYEQVVGLDLRSHSAIIVAIGEDFQANVMTVMNLRQVGVKLIVAKAQTELHGRLLKKMGVDFVILPEIQSAHQLVRQLTEDNLVSLFELGNEYRIVEFKASPEMYGKTVRQLKIRETYRCNVIALKKGAKVELIEDGNEQILEGHYMVLAGRTENLKSFDKLLKEQMSNAPSH